jgi:hypothetical protein
MVIEDVADSSSLCQPEKQGGRSDEGAMKWSGERT